MNSDATIALQYYIPGTHDLIVDVILLALLFGVLTVLSIISTARLVRRGVRQLSTTFMIWSVLVLYVSTTAHLGMEIAYSVGCIRLVNDAVASLSSTSDSFNDNNLIGFRQAAKTKSYIISAALATNVAIGDVIVWWRAFALWRTRSMIALGAVSLVVSSALGILSMIRDGSGQIYIYIPLPPRIQIYSDVFGAAFGILSLLTNVTATLMIAQKAWEHRKILRLALGTSNGKWMTPTMRVLLLLVESGTVYSIILAIAIIYNFLLSSPSGVASSSEFISVTKMFLGGCFVPILAIYPTFITFVVAIKQSVMEGSLMNIDQNHNATPVSVHRILPDETFVRSSETTHIPLDTLRFSHNESTSESPENVSVGNVSPDDSYT